MKRSAFTLVELLIVMAVIAALISVVAPMGLNALKQARTVQVATDLRTIMNEMIGKTAARGQYVAPVKADYKDYESYGLINTITGVTDTGLITVALNDMSRYDETYLEGAFGSDSTKSMYYVSADDEFVFSVSSYIYD